VVLREHRFVSVMRASGGLLVNEVKKARGPILDPSYYLLPW